MSDTVSPHATTAEVWTRGGRLPDLDALAAAVRRAGGQFTLRGVEATITGTIEADGDRLLLRTARTGETVVVVPLRQKVQYDPRRKRRMAATRAERGAYRRLAKEWRRHPGPLRLTGPLVKAREGGPLALEAREFAWDPPSAVSVPPLPPAIAPRLPLPLIVDAIED